MTATTPERNELITSFFLDHTTSTEQTLVLLRIPIGFHLTLTEVVVLIPHFV